MTDYTNIPNANLETGKPIRAVDGRALRDNPIAMFEGAPGAPRLVGEAVANERDGLETLSIVASNSYELTEGAGPVSGQTSNISLSFVVAKTWTMRCFTGSCRLAFRHVRQSGSAGESQARVLLNGAQVAAWNTITAADRVVDVDISAGDVVTLEHRLTGTAGSPSSIISNISMMGSNAYLPTSVYRRAQP